jgi:hypothetical protein
MCRARRLIEIDPNVVSGLVDFLETRQSAVGQFTEPQYVYHMEMVGGVQKDDISITAYTVLSLLECCSDKEKPILTKSVCTAVQYMQAQLRAGSVKRPYAQAIVYLALVKACTLRECGICRIQGVCENAIIENLRKDFFGKKVISVDGSVHWEADESVGKAYWYKRNTAAISVEMTAYALEASLAVLDCETAASIAKWLRSSRNSPETFVSVQDTVAVLNALSKFAAGCTTTIKHPPNLCVKVIRMAEPEKVYYAFSVTAENAALMQRIPIRLNDIYKVVTCGTGLGQAQVHIEYNILRTQKKQCAFNMTVSAREVLLNNTGGERYAAEIEFCVRYLGSHCIGFAIVEVELPTGYQACEHRGKNISDSLCLKDVCYH